MNTDDGNLLPDPLTYELTDEVKRLDFKEAARMLKELRGDIFINELRYEFPDLNKKNSVFCSTNLRFVRRVKIKDQGKRTLEQHNRGLLLHLVEHLILNLDRLIKSDSVAPMYIRALYYSLSNDLSKQIFNLPERSSNRDKSAKRSSNRLSERRVAANTTAELTKQIDNLAESSSNRDKSAKRSSNRLSKRRVAANTTAELTKQIDNLAISGSNRDKLAKRSSIRLSKRRVVVNTTAELAKKKPDAMYITVDKIFEYIDCICCLFKCDRESLGVTACDITSSYVGNIILERQNISGLEQKVIVEDGSALTQPYRINFSNIKSIRPSEEPPRCILVVEKMTLFNSLVSSDILKKLPCVIISGSGQPSIECRLFVKKVHEALEGVPIFAFVDCNPFGLDIFKSYKYGSMNLAFMSKNLVVASIRLLGLFHSDIVACHVKAYDLMVLEKSDSNRLKNLRKEEWVQHEPDILESLNTTVIIERKADVEKLATKLGYTLFVDKIREKITSILER